MTDWLVVCWWALVLRLRGFTACRAATLPLPALPGRARTFVEAGLSVSLPSTYTLC
jgi:hypothetical protein